MDLNGDGLQDILIGSFSGVPQWIERGKDGFGEPTNILDKNGDLVVISNFWNRKTKKWDTTTRSGSVGHCSSVAAVDWEGDGDLDLLLGDYKAGALFLRLNEGSADDPRYAVTNDIVKVGEASVAFEHGVGAPRIADWNGDGLFDILIGTIYGGVYLAQNEGSKSAPRFDKMVTLVEPIPGKAGSKSVKRVPAQDGQPVAPGSSFHIEPVDYDGDGDLDLLVGARSKWSTGPVKEPTAEDHARVKALAVAAKEIDDLRATVASDEEFQKLRRTAPYRATVAKHRALLTEQRKAMAEPTQIGDFVWLFRRK